MVELTIDHMKLCEAHELCLVNVYLGKAVLMAS